MVGGRKRRRSQYHLGLQTKSSCRSWRRAVSGLLVDADETRAMKILEARVNVSGVIGSGRVSKRKGSESPA